MTINKINTEELKQVVHRVWCNNQNLDFGTAQKINDSNDPRPILDQILDRLGLLETYEKCGRPIKNFDFWWAIMTRKKNQLTHKQDKYRR